MYQRLKGAIGAALLAIRQPGSFLRNFAVSISGTAAVTVGGLLLAPVISRLYRPSDYGEYTVFSILLGNLSIISSLGYLGAMLLPRRHQRFVALSQLVLWLSFIASVLFMLLLVLFEDAILTFFDIHTVGSMVYWIPVILLTSVLAVCLQSLCIRENKYPVKTVADIGANMTGKGYNIAHALWFGPSPVAFVIGDLLNRLVNVGLIVFRLPAWQTRQMLVKVPLRQLTKTAAFFRRFPTQVLPSTYLNIFSSQLPILTLKRFCSSAEVGAFSFAISMLELPIGLIGGVLAPIVMRDAVQAYHEGGIEKLGPYCLGYFRKIFFFVAIPFAAVMVLGDLIFPFVFGAQWHTAGLVACLLGAYYAFRLNYYIFVAVYNIVHKQLYDLYFNVCLLLGRFLSIYFVVQSHGFLYAVGAYSAVSLVLTALNSYLILWTVGVRVLRVIVEQLVYFCGLLLLFYLLRLGVVKLLI